MTLKKVLDSIDEIIKREPYTREEIASIWKEQAEQEWEPQTIIAYAAACEYLHRVGKPEAEFLRGKYQRLLNQLKEKYITTTS